MATISPTQQRFVNTYDPFGTASVGSAGGGVVSSTQQLDSALPDLMGGYTSPKSLGSGTSSSQLTQAGEYLNAGKTSFTDDTAGYILGIDQTDGKAKFRLGSAGQYMYFDGSSLTVVGGINVSSINIPDSTTANSFHVDSQGNTWWGANVASGLANANASVDKTGAAIFKSVQIGGTTIQYVITNSGIFSFGDGSDGDLTVTSNVTLTSDKYYNNLTINNGAVFNPGGYRVFVKGTLTIGGASAGTIDRSGVAGGNGSGTTGGASGTALADGYLKGSQVGGAGGHGGNSTGGNDSAAPGGNGSNTSNSLGSNASAGGAGGRGSDGGAGQAGGAAGAAGTVTASNVKLIANWHLATLLDVSSTGSTVKFDNSASSGGGGGGGRDGAGGNGGGGGGGGGSGGGIVAIYARVITINANGSITANGANGGNGANAVGGNCGGGGGGSGGNGGVIILVYNTLTNNGSITTSAGTKGTKGTGTGTGLNGSDGSNGTAGTIYQFQLSL